MQQYEYREISLDDKPGLSVIEILNEQGKDGWDFCSSLGETLIFQRALPDIYEMVKRATQERFLSTGQLTVGEMIAALASMPGTHYVRYDFGNFVPTKVNSYRGYYDCPAIGYDDHPNRTAEEVVEELRSCLSREYSGWKGGEYSYDENSFLWVANYGDSTGVAPVAVEDREYFALIRTAYVED